MTICAFVFLSILSVCLCDNLEADTYAATSAFIATIGDSRSQWDSDEDPPDRWFGSSKVFRVDDSETLISM